MSLTEKLSSMWEAAVKMAFGKQRNEFDAEASRIDASVTEHVLTMNEWLALPETRPKVVAELLSLADAAEKLGASWIKYAYQVRERCRAYTGETGGLS